MRESRMRPPILTSNIFANNLSKITIPIYMYVYAFNKTLIKLQWCSTNIIGVITDLRCEGHYATTCMYWLNMKFNCAKTLNNIFDFNNNMIKYIANTSKTNISIKEIINNKQILTTANLLVRVLSVCNPMM